VKWTKKKPTKLGWYWIRTNYGEGVITYGLWEVYEYLDDEQEKSRLHYPMEPRGLSRWWYGPIQHPKWVKP
jgi:hypothetical protein